MTHLKELIEKAWDDRALLKEAKVKKAVREVISLLDKGELRIAEAVDPDPRDESDRETHERPWIIHEWIKKAVILYFPLNQMKTTKAGTLEFHDKIPLKKGYKKLGIRVVPHAVARYGSYIAKGVVIMPSYVNIGAYIDAGSMVDTWATVGSCAQIGKNVHLSGGVGIGGVLEPVQAAPVIVEDGCFIGSRSIIVEGVHVGKEAVLGANTVITKSTRIIDVSVKESIDYKAFIPERSVVIPGTAQKYFPAGDYPVPCVLIIGKRKASTDLKTSLNEALRDFNMAV